MIQLQYSFYLSRENVTQGKDTQRQVFKAIYSALPQKKCNSHSKTSTHKSHFQLFSVYWVLFFSFSEKQIE